jgi:hypothetical protein
VSVSEQPEVASAALPPDSELVVGVVGAVGVDLGAVARQLIAELAQFRYRGLDLHLTDAFDAFEWAEQLVEEPYDERLWSYMSAGDELRDKWTRRDAMALLAINRIALERVSIAGNERSPADRVAYVLRSFKRPEEVKLLREVLRRPKEVADKGGVWDVSGRGRGSSLCRTRPAGRCGRLHVRG